MSAEKYTGDGMRLAVIDTGYSTGWNNGDIAYQWDFANGDSSALNPQADTHGSLVANVALQHSPKIEIIHLKVFSDYGKNASYADIEKALQWVVNNATDYNIAAVNLSLGGGYANRSTTTPLSDEFAQLANKGVLSFAAAGNSGFFNLFKDVSSIAADPNNIAVSASDGAGSLAWWSQRHPTLTDITADGVKVPVTNASGVTYQINGTSFSTPTVAATAVRAQDAAEDIRGSRLTQNEFVTVAKATGESVMSGTYKELNADALMDELVNRYLPGGTPPTTPDDTTSTPSDDSYVASAPTSFAKEYGQGGGQWNSGWVNETLAGTTANEKFHINYGSDTLTGGGGSDVFAFNSVTDHDVITDFKANNDFLDLGFWASSWGGTKASINSVGDTVLSIYHGNSTVTLKGVSAGDWSKIRDVTYGAFLTNAANKASAGLADVRAGVDVSATATSLLMVRDERGVARLYASDGENETLIAGTPDATNLNWTLAASGDIDGDGDIDAIWRNLQTGGNAVWRLQNGAFQSAENLRTAENQRWQIAGAGDFNSDGQADLLWRNSETGQNAVWFQDDTRTDSIQMIRSAADTDWQVADVTDDNNDGFVDILWRNTRSQTRATWFMQGVTVISTGEASGDGRGDSGNVIGYAVPAFDGELTLADALTTLTSTV